MNREDYEYSQAEGLKSISESYEKRVDIPKDKDGLGLSGAGSRSLFNRYCIFFLNDGPVSAEDGAPLGSIMSYFDTPGNWKGQSFDATTGVENISSSNIIRKCSDGAHNGIDYEWSDFLYAKNNNRIPNNHLITLRRFGAPVGDNLYSKVACPTPDIARAVTWIDGENNKLEDLLKFSVGYGWENKTSRIQELQSTGWGRESNLLSGKAATWAGRLTSLVNNETESLRNNDDKIESFDPFQNKTNLTMGSLNVIQDMLVRKKGLEFKQDIKLVFEYEMKSFDGIDTKVAFIDLISHLLILSYSRGEFWGGDTRYIGGARRKSLVGDKALEKLQSGDFSGFLKEGFATISGKLSDMTGGLGFSVDGIKNFGKNAIGGFGNMLIAGGLNSIGRPELQSMEALLTGEPTGEWHITVGNPFNPMVSIGNLCLESAEFSFEGPLSYNDFPSKLKVEITLKPGRPRDRTDVMSMFAPNVGRTYYTDPPSSTVYAMNNSSNTSLTYKASGATKAKDNLEKQFDARLINDLKDVQSRFPNHTDAGLGQEKINWSAQWTT
jgi:hypothetical protein